MKIPRDPALLMPHACCLAVAMLAACTDTTETTAHESTGSSIQQGDTEPVVYSSTYEGIQTLLFEGQGCTNATCHDTDSAAGELDLTAEVSYEELVGIPSSGSSLVRVEIGDRARSYLYLKLLAATAPETAAIAGSPMPVGASPIPPELLAALRLWIYAGAPETGTVMGTAELLELDLPESAPITITPLPPPDPEEGFQFVLPPWPIPAASEREVCFASYFDIRDQVPDSAKDDTGEYALVDAEILRQDPQSHHLILSRSTLPVEDIHHADFGPWACRGGELDGDPCEPLDLDSCGAGQCTTTPQDSFACIGYGPPVSGSTFGRVGIAGAQKAQNYKQLPEGVYERVPLSGILLWNSHAFNLTTEDHLMNGRINVLYAKDPKYRSRSFGFQASTDIFSPDTPPFERGEFCSTLTLKEGAHLIRLSSHTHKRGEEFRISHPDGTLLYENFIYNDPVDTLFDPPLVFDSEEDDDRTLHYCAVYNNGVGADGEPDVDTVTRYSRLPDSVHIPGVPGLCTPEACVNGLVAAPCEGTQDHASCDSAPGQGDGFCDACAITGGESTENEMFLILGNYYLMDDAE